MKQRTFWRRQADKSPTVRKFRKIGRVVADTYHRYLEEVRREEGSSLLQLFTERGGIVDGRVFRRGRALEKFAIASKFLRDVAVSVGPTARYYVLGFNGIINIHPGQHMTKGRRFHPALIMNYITCVQIGRVFSPINVVRGSQQHANVFALVNRVYVEEDLSRGGPSGRAFDSPPPDYEPENASWMVTQRNVRVLSVANITPGIASGFIASAYNHVSGFADGFILSIYSRVRNEMNNVMLSVVGRVGELNGLMAGFVTIVDRASTDSRALQVGLLNFYKSEDGWHVRPLFKDHYEYPPPGVIDVVMDYLSYRLSAVVDRFRKQED